MDKRTPRIIIGLMLTLTLALTAYADEMVKDFNKIPVKGSVTMIDLGAKKCIPCKMMAPILEKLEKTYQGKADIVFIDVWQNNDQGTRFKVSAIPTQIFFDKNGQEVFRHVGFMDEESIIRQLTKMGVLSPGKEPKNKG
jgi:thioredoxin 1